MELHLLILIGLLLIPAVLAAFAMDLLRAAIALLVASLGLALTMFNLGAPLAGSFELSVGAGLITVLFVNAISLTRLVSEEERLERTKDHYRRFALLPVLAILIGALMYRTQDFWAAGLEFVKYDEAGTVGDILWKSRGLDLIGQIVIILVGVYGVAILFRRGNPNG